MSYLSPTSFIKSRKCIKQVALLKIDKVIEEEEQTLPMATGNAFDIIVKSHINKRYDQDSLLKLKIPNESLRTSAMIVANAIWEHYKDGPFKELQKEGIGYVGVDQEVELSYEGMTSNLYGMPDVVLTDGTVIDWKVNGAYSNKGTTPTNGYLRCYLDGKDLGPSGDCDVFLENINEDWAIQTYLYARLLGKAPGTDIRAGIEQIAIRGSTVHCASYRNSISKTWQLLIEKEFHSNYNKLFKHPENIGNGNPNPWRCYSYGKLCPVAKFCPGYQIKDKIDNNELKFKGID